MAQLGVFLIPPADHPFYRVATDILGYDVWQRHQIPSSLAGHLDPDTVRRWIGEATIFGIHCTIAGAALFYDDADIPEIEQRLAWIAGRTAPFTLENGRFYEDFHANPHVLVSQFDSPDGAIQRLHRQVVTIVSPLHTGSAYAPRVPSLDEKAREIYRRVGEPWALDFFWPHWSLLTGLPDAEARERARDLIVQHTGLFADEWTRTLEIADVHLVQRNDDGYFSVIASYPLGG